MSIDYVRILPYTQQQAEECPTYTYGYLRIRPRQDMTSPNDASRSNSRLTDGSRRSSFGSTTSNAAEVSVFCITHHYIVVGDWKFCVAFHHALSLPVQHLLSPVESPEGDLYQVRVLLFIILQHERDAHIDTTCVYVSLCAQALPSLSPFFNMHISCIYKVVDFMLRMSVISSMVSQGRQEYQQRTL